MRGFIIDDETAPRVILKHLLGQITPKVDIIGEADNLESGIAAIQQTEIDVLFLDIEMPKYTGLEITKLMEVPLNFEIIFVTAYSNHAINAFKLSAFDYLLKPVRKEDLQDSLQRLEQKKEYEGSNQLEVLQNNLSNQGNSQYVLRTHREEFIININDIIHLEADGMYTNIIMENDRITASKPMKDILSDLPDTFFRTHRSYAINLDQVLLPVRITQNGIMTKQKTIVPLSARKKDLFLQAIG